MLVRSVSPSPCRAMLPSIYTKLVCVCVCMLVGSVNQMDWKYLQLLIALRARASRTTAHTDCDMLIRTWFHVVYACFHRNRRRAVVLIDTTTNYAETIMSIAITVHMNDAALRWPCGCESESQMQECIGFWAVA